MKQVLIIGILVVSGLCFTAWAKDFYVMHIEEAMEACSEHGGVGEYTRRLPYHEVTCYNGMVYPIEKNNRTYSSK